MDIIQLGQYFNNSIHFLNKNEIIISAFILIEYFPILSHSVSAALKLGYYQQVFESENNAQSYLSYLSIYFYFRKLKACGEDVKSYSFNCAYSSYMILLPVILQINYVVYIEYLQLNKTESGKKENALKIIYNIFMINFYDLIFFRCAGMLMLDICIDFLIASLYFHDLAKRFLLIVTSLIILFCIIVSYFRHLLFFNMWIQMLPTISYPFERKITLKYEQSLLILKIIIAIETCIFDNSNKIIDYRIIFVNILIIFFVLLFNIQMIYAFCFNSRIFFVNKRMNLLRMFISIFNGLSVVFTILFQSNLNTVFSVVLFSSIFFLSLFLTLAIERISRKKIVFGDNIIAQIYFLLNEISCERLSSANQMIGDLIIGHKTRCIMVNNNSNNCILCEGVSKYSSNAIVKKKAMKYASPQGMMTNFSEVSSLIHNKQREVYLCNNTHCNIIDLNHELLSPIIFVYLLFKMFKQRLKNKIESLGDKELEQDYDIIRLTISYLKKNQNIFKLHTLFFNLIVKYQNAKEIDLSFNLEMYYDQFCKDHEAETKKFQYLLVIEKLTMSISNFLSFLEQFLFFTSKDPLAFVKASEEIKKLKDSIKNSFFLKRETQSNYQLLILRYLLEEIFNRTLSKHLEPIKEEIKTLEEFLDVHFTHDKFLLLKYDIEDNKFIITQAGGEFRDMNQSYFFEQLIPAEFREEGIEKFRSLLNRNNFIDKNNWYEFVFQNNQNYVSLFKMKYNVYPSLVNKEMFISGDYRIGSEEILIFNLLDIQGKCSEVLHSFSMKMGRFFKLEPEWLKQLNRKKKYITLEDMLQHASFEHNNGKANSIAYILNWEKYVKIFTRYLYNDRLEMGLKEIELTDRLNELMELEKSIILNRRVLILTKKFKIADNSTNSSKNKEYIVYSVKEKVFGNNEYKYSNSLIDDKDQNESSMINLLENNNEYNNLACFITSNSSSVCGTSMTTKSNLSNVKHGSDKKIHQEQRKEYKKFKNVTLLIICFNIFLLLFTLAFLVIETSENEGFKNLFKVYIDFRKLNRYFFHNTLSLISNFCICQTGTSACSNKYVKYSMAFRAKNAVMADYMINKYIERELDLKASGMQAAFKTCERELYHLNDEDLNGILSNGFPYFSLERTEKSIASTKKQITFSEAVELYINTIGLIINSEGYHDFPIYIISIDGDQVNLSNIYLPENINDIQMFSYNLIMNYANYLTRFFEIENDMKFLFIQIIQKNETILLAFTLGLLGLHCLLLVICMCFLRLFKFIIKKYIKELMDRISDAKYLDYWKKKITNMKLLLKFYEKNPNYLITTLNALKTGECERRTSDTKKNITESQSNIIDMHMQFYFKDEYHNQIILKFAKIIFLAFGIYFVYCLSYYGILVLSLENLNITIDYFDKHASMENNVFITHGLIHLMALTNQTEKKISDKFGYVKSNGYVSNKIQETLGYVNEIEEMEITYPTMFLSVKNTIDLDCNTLFNTLNDSVLFETDELYPTRNYYEMAQHICQSVVSISFYKDDKILTEEITYNSQKLLSEFTDMTYKSLMEINSSDLLYESYTTILILFRQLRTYINDTLFPKIIDSVTSNYTVVVVTFLLLNLLVEVVMLAILHLCVIKKIVNINKNMIGLYHCINE